LCSDMVGYRPVHLFVSGAVAEDQQNLKALYRRGQAYAALQQYQQAEQDLQAAAELSGGDQQQLKLIKEKLSSVRAQLAARPEPKQQQQQPQQQQESRAPPPQQQQQEQQTLYQEQRQEPPPKPAAEPQEAAAAAAIKGSSADSCSSYQQLGKQSVADKTSTTSLDEEDGLIEEIVDVRVPSSSQQQPQVVMDFGSAGSAPAARSSSSTAKRAAAAAAAAAGDNSSGSTGAAAAATGGLGGLPEMQQMAEMMRNNPAMMRQASRLVHLWGGVRRVCLGASQAPKSRSRVA
jgi:hypothetical protein